MNERPTRHDAVSIWLHWVVGLAIIALALIEILRGELLPKGSGLREMLKSLHEPAGSIVFLLVLVRLVWRSTHPVPAALPGAGRWERQAATAAHLTLYACMVLIPLSGLAYTFARGRSVDFGIFQVALPLKQFVSRDAARAIKEVHELLGQAVLALALVHAAAALWHHYVRKDGVLARMLPGGRR